MYKVKIVFLYTDSKNQCTWSHQWVDWDGQVEMKGVIAEYHEKEETALKEDNIDKEIQHVAVFEVDDITTGDYLCDGCGCYLADNDDGFCPYCDCSVIIDVSEIDKPEPQPKDSSGPRLHKG